MKIDLHVHTFYSHQTIFFYDGVDSPEKIVKYAKKKGLDAIAITDHDSMAGLKRAVDEGKRKGVLIVPGCEISTKEGHILAYGITEEIPPFLPAEEAIERIREQGGVVVIPHPFSGFGVSLGTKVSKLDFDAIEVWNGSLLAPWQNILAEKLADRLNCPKTAGSDAHMAEHVGLGITEVEGEDVEDVLDSIERGRTEVVGKRSMTLFDLSEWLRRRAEMNKEYTSIYFSRKRKTKPVSFLYRILLRAPRILDVMYLPPAYLVKYMLNRSGKRFLKESDSIIKV